MLLAARVNLRPHKGSQTAKVNVAAQALSASITRAGIWREVWKFVRPPLPLLRVWRGRFFDHNIWPDFRVFRIQRQPFLKPRLGVRLDRVDRAFRHADSAIDAFVRVDDEHVLALVEAVHGAHVDAVHDFAENTALVYDAVQLSVLSSDRSGELTHAVANSFIVSVLLAVLVDWLKMDAQKTYVLWLNRNTEEQALSGRGTRARQVAAHLSAEVRAVRANTDPPMRTARS